MLINNTITEKANIIALLNETLSRYSRPTVTEEDVNLSEVTALNGDLESNTKVVITNASGKNKLTNPINFTYTRLSLPEILKRKKAAMGEDPVIDLNGETFESFTDDKFRELLISKFILNPLAVTIVISTSGNTKTATIKPARESANYLYIGEITFSITKEEP